MLTAEQPLYYNYKGNITSTTHMVVNLLLLDIAPNLLLWWRCCLPALLGGVWWLLVEPLLVFCCWYIVRIAWTEYDVTKTASTWHDPEGSNKSSVKEYPWSDKTTINMNLRTVTGSYRRTSNNSSNNIPTPNINLFLVPYCLLLCMHVPSENGRLHNKITKKHLK